MRRRPPARPFTAVYRLNLFPRVIVLVPRGNYASDPKADPKFGAPLSPIGAAQANLIGAYLARPGKHFDAFFIGRMRRARDAAAVIARGLPGSVSGVDDDLTGCTPPT